ncbi:MAG: tRNA pseudouridine(55) synthase TruB [Deltaproteobacteria bacterium]|nr:tRNA pseudouridine(55) synthase TruB [Deltaproteobacteria bacterium]
MAEHQNKPLSLSFQPSGILLVDKPEGPSSAQVVQRVKKILGAKKVGHLGTLDPFASGLLPLGINDGTKIADLFLTAQKSYSGVIALGVETDTQDSTGKVLEVRDVPSLTRSDLEKLQEAFTGTLTQTPPMYSALKKGGVRLYRLARQGRSVPRSPREIKIDRLRLWCLGPAEVGIEVTCSKGTYIRTLAADMGQFLGCGAHLKSLRRFSCGPLTLERAVPLSDVETLREQGKLPVISLNQALAFLREFRLADHLLPRLRMGQQEMLRGLPGPEEGECTIRLLDAQGSLVALARWLEGVPKGRWRLFRVFGSG